MSRVNHPALWFLALVLMLRPASAADRLIDGVPLPSDTVVASQSDSEPAAQRQWAGVWVGAWGGTLKHILLVESVSQDGAARVVYSVGDNPSFGIKAAWYRHRATASRHSLTIDGSHFSATYNLTDRGTLQATYVRGNVRSQATMRRADFTALTTPGAAVDWMTGKSEFLQTDLVENGKPVRLEAIIFKPPGAGPFPLAVINHGSTGRGTNPALFTQTWFSVGLAEVLNDRGWIVAFPQRRGRGKSDGRYDEGFATDRARGYTCETDRSLRGADRALRDIDAAIAALRRRADVAPSPVLIGGQSRGGVLAIAYAGGHPDTTAGVIDFVGGWMGEGCPTATTINQTLFKRGARYDKPTLWLYGHGDPYYAIPHSRRNFMAFQKAGGKGTFLEFDVPSGNGHGVIGYPQLWSDPLRVYLATLAATKR